MNEQKLKRIEDYVEEHDNVSMTALCNEFNISMSTVSYTHLIDGSQLPFDENVAVTRAAVEIARPRGVSVEAEIGSVGYSDNADAKRRFTDPGEAERFAVLTGVDALAVAVGTVHRMETQGVDSPQSVPGASGRTPCAGWCPC